MQQQLFEQSFWVHFVRQVYAQEITALRARGEQLLDLQAAQQQWLDADSGVMKIHWRGEVVRLAKLLGMPDSEVKPDRVLSDDRYTAEMGELGVREMALVFKLTGDAMQRHKL